MHTTRPASPPSHRAAGIDTARALITVLVVAHHAVLAYHPYAPPPDVFTGANLFWSAFPVVDTHRAAGVDLFVGFNDTFFMALMFLLSGLFAWPSLARKGAGGFLRDRVLRLGLPFVIAAGVLAPLAYAPAWLQRGGAGGAGAFVDAWLGLGAWPAGPAWFLWVLLAFDLCASLAWRLAPRCAGQAAQRVAGWPPVGWWAVLCGLGLVAYVPLAQHVGAMDWWHAGPFFVQTSRVLLYALFFAAGVVIGARGIDRGLVAVDGALARHWLRWPLAALVAYAALVVAYVAMLSARASGDTTAAPDLIVAGAFVVCCVTASLAWLAPCLRFGAQPRKWLTSLSRNAFGIYLVHYAFVSWLQFALLAPEWPGSAKALLAFGGALAASWFVAALLRRVPAIARVI